MRKWQNYNSLCGPWISVPWLTVVVEVSSLPVKSIPPNTENSMQYGYDENDNNNMTKRETKRETNYSINNK